MAWLHHRGHTPSDPSETPQWWFTHCLAWIPCIIFHINRQLHIHCMFLLCWVQYLNVHSSIVANCDHMLEWINGVPACIGITMQLVTLWKPHLVFVLPVSKLHFALYLLSRSLEVTRSMWLLTIHHLFHLSAVWTVVAISGITCVLLMMFLLLKTCKVIAAGTFLTFTQFETESKWPEFRGIVVNAWSNQYSTKASFSFRSLIVSSCCSSHGRRPCRVP